MYYISSYKMLINKYGHKINKTKLNENIKYKCCDTIDTHIRINTHILFVQMIYILFSFHCWAMHVFSIYYICILKIIEHNQLFCHI